jgi:hypothetical protein
MFSAGLSLGSTQRLPLAIAARVCGGACMQFGNHGLTSKAIMRRKSSLLATREI